MVKSETPISFPGFLWVGLGFSILITVFFIKTYCREGHSFEFEFEFFDSDNDAIDKVEDIYCD